VSIPPRSRGSVGAQAERSYIARQVILPAQAFIHTQAVSAAVLFAAALTAIIWANSPWKESYFDLWETTIIVDVGLFSIEKDLRHWVNEGLMVFFFFVVTLEIKRELVHGELSDPRRAALPVAAALGGMTLPAAIYLALNAGGDGERGWGIPMATDVAFALGVLALVGKRIPTEVRIFLLALAIVDDIGAIAVIALFYSEAISLEALGIAVLLLGVIIAMSRGGVNSMNPYFVVGALLWVAVLKSGINATITGVVLGTLAPATPYFAERTFADSTDRLVQRFRGAVAEGNEELAETILGQMEELVLGTEAHLERLLRLLQPWTSYAAVPLFALANAGITLSGEAVGDAASSSVTLGVIAGLLAGKLLGIVGFSWIAVRLGLCSLPRGMTWAQMVGVGLIAGIGFTVSLFITDLAFTDSELVSNAKIGIVVASVLAGMVGYVLLRIATAGHGDRQPPDRPPLAEPVGFQVRRVPGRPRR
jgi:NhaA family Na+:H+ antiporter